MTIKIKLSQLFQTGFTPAEFAARVIAFVAARAEYLAHLEGVKLDAENDELKPEERRVAFPGPMDHPLVMDAAAGYEFEGPTLDEKKAALFAKVREMETAALHEIMPPHKIRHWQFQEQDIREAHAKAVNEFVAAKQKAGETFSADDLPKMDENDAELLARHEQRKVRVASAQRSAAHLESQIGDLTEDNVDNYEIGKTFA